MKKNNDECPIVENEIEFLPINRNPQFCINFNKNRKIYGNWEGLEEIKK